MTRTEFLRDQTVRGLNKCKRTPIPQLSVSQEPYSLAERKAIALKRMFELMPVYIGPKELIVGTRTFFAPKEGNEDGHSRFKYGLGAGFRYVNDSDTEKFGCDQSYINKTHFTPDLSIILDKGIDGILRDVNEKKKEQGLSAVNIEFLSSVSIAYCGLKCLILRYRDEANRLAKEREGEEKHELEEIARVCEKISAAPPDSFREAIQLLWFTHLGTIIESFEFINYGRLDVILGGFLKDTPREAALHLVECLLLKMYDQADIITSYLGNYAAQLVVTLGGVLPNGESAVNEVTELFLEAVNNTRLPEPEINLRVSSKNPVGFLDKAAELTVSGCNFISYYNDDLLVESLNKAGIPIDMARSYGFDLCQDINIPGKGDFWLAGNVSLANVMMDMLKEKKDFPDFESLMREMKKRISAKIGDKLQRFNLGEKQLFLYASGRENEYFDGIRNHNKPVDRGGCSPMSPLPFLSALYHGCIDNALDVIFEPYPVKDKGMIFGTAVETINSLAAIKKSVFDEKRFSLEEVCCACESDFDGDRGRIIRGVLLNCPKWGNDIEYVDSIAKELLEFCLGECQKHTTFLGGRILGGIHQPHPVPTGARLMATPDGRKAGAPVAVTLTPASGTSENGPTAVLSSASKLDPMLIQWNCCVMVNYFASVFRGNEGKEIFKSLLLNYFKMGGLQHQPNVSDVNSLKQAQTEPEKYKDLIVRLWGVSAHFVDLPRELQDEMIARFA